MTLLLILKLRMSAFIFPIHRFPGLTLENATTITIVRKKYLVFAVFSRLFFDHFMESFENQIFKIETLYVVGNKAKGQISKLVLQENKARQIFRKTNISYP